MEVLAPPMVSFDFTDLEHILSEICILFNTSPEPQELKQLAQSFAQARNKEKQAHLLGSHALVSRQESSGEGELLERQREFERLEIICKQVEQDLAKIQAEYQASCSQERDLQAEIVELQNMLADKEQAFVDLGGEAKYRQVLKLGSSSAASTTAAAGDAVEKPTSFPQLRRILALFYNVTQIQWDLTCDEEETCGRVVDSDRGVIKQFRFGPMDEFELANRVWNTIG